MKFFIILAALVAVGAASPFVVPVHPKDVISASGRIISGYPAADNQFPWQASVRAISGIGASLCGGSLIHTGWVLTAAHCVKGFSSFQIGLGAKSLNNPGQKIDSKEGIFHPNYNSNLNNDVALIKLSQSAVENNSVKVIRLAKRSHVDETFLGKKLTVSGWGLTSNNGNTAADLRYVYIKPITNTDCAKVYGTQIIISSTICGNGFEVINQSTCNGDSGGPLVFDEDGNFTQIGVVSFVSSRGCDSGDPSGYVRTASFLTWISSYTGLPIRE